MLPLPMPDGGFITFRIEESSVLDNQLSDQFQQIKSYRGEAIDSESTTMRCDLTPQGFHATILFNDKVISVHPAPGFGAPGFGAPGFGAPGFGTATEAVEYVSSSDEAQKGFQCLTREAQVSRVASDDGLNLTQANLTEVGGQRRTYRIAIAATSEFCNTYGGGNVAGTVAALNTWLNAANAIYERELSVHMNLVNNTNIIYSADRGFNVSTDPFSNGDPNAMLDQARGVMRDVVGAANFDVGHVLGAMSEGSGGAAFVRSVGNNDDSDGKGPIKGGGASIVSGAAGNSTFAGVWAHELGHQFGANHSFNGTVGNCGGVGHSNSTAYEPGSGSTIMSYAGICDSDNVTLTRENRFHAGSLEEINTYLNFIGACATNTATGNNVPTVNGGGNHTIPKNTPFTLTATGGDADAGDATNLTYVWDEVDAGGSYTNSPYSDTGDPSVTTRPIFRSFAPTLSPARTFPSLNHILNNANEPPDVVDGLQTAEELPHVGRALNFTVTIRDQRGGVNSDRVLLNVDGASGPFLVTAPNGATTWTGGGPQTVTWNVNNTNVAPVGCANVRITLSADGGATFPYVLAASAPNDGSETISVPLGVSTSTARVKVEAVSNVFFDISDASFTVIQNPSCAYSISPTSQTMAGAAGTSSVNVTTGGGCLWTAISNAAWITVISGASGSGNGAVQYSVTINPGAQRVGTITIAGQTFTVTQGPGCSYSVSPMSQNFTTSGGTGSMSVTTISVCAWTAASNAVWITVTSGASGSGNGAAQYSVAANTGLPRTGTITIAGQVATITQAGDTGGLMYYPLAFPIRLLDTRPGASACNAPSAPLTAYSTRTQQTTGSCSGLTIPASARAVVGNATVVNSISNGGYITLYSSDAAQPNASNLNFAAGQVVPNSFVTGLGSGGAFKIFASADTHFIVDIAGYYAPPGQGGLYYHPLSAPVRLLDTRPGASACYALGSPLAANGAKLQQARGVCGGSTIQAAAKAVLGNATIVNDVSAGGYITLYPSNAGQPNVSNLNFTAGQIVPNSFVAGLGTDGAFKIFSSAGTNFIVDIAGYFSDEQTDANGTGLLYYPLSSPVRLLDSRPGMGACYAPGTPLANDGVRTQLAASSCGGATIPATAKAVQGNATVVNFQSGGGWITLYPSNAAQPNASNLNYTANQVVPNAFVVGLGADGALKIFSKASTDFIVDLAGYFAP